MISPTLSKQKESYHRRLQSARYKASLKHLKNDTSALRRSFERKNPTTRDDDIQYYREVEEECLKYIRALISTSHIRSTKTINTPQLKSKKMLLSEVSNLFTLNGKKIDFHNVALNTVQSIERALHFTEIHTMMEICTDFDEEEYEQTRNLLNKLFHTDAFPFYEDLSIDILEFSDILYELDRSFHIYVEHFYKVYLHYKSKFEEAHELKRVLLSKDSINSAVVNDTLFLYVLVHGEISYEGNDLVMMKSPVEVDHLMHATPGCVFFTSGYERRLYDKVNLYIKQNADDDQMIQRVIKSTIPMMTTMNDKVKKDTMKRNQTKSYVRNYIIHHKSAPHIFHTKKGAMMNNKHFAFELHVNPIHMTKHFNIEGLKVIHHRNIEDTIDLVDYLKLKINEDNQIVFTLDDVIQLLDNVHHLVMIDASCQTSIHSQKKTFENYTRKHL
jgi:hypothetical protein